MIERFWFPTIAVLVLIISVVGIIVANHDRVAIDGSKWECTASRPKGITAECTVYMLKEAR